jgi:succinyl-CoA synthetase alpha subunit
LFPTNSFQERSAASAAGQQRRSYHTSRRPRLSTPSYQSPQQRRSLYLHGEHSTSLLKSYNINISSSAPKGTSSTHYLGISVARSDRKPCIIASPTTDVAQLPHRVRRFPFDYRQGPSKETIASALSCLQLDAAPPKAKAQAVGLINSLWKLYTEKEAITATLSLALSPSEDSLITYDPYLFFDDAAFKSNKRQADLHSLRDTSVLSPIELEAETAGIVYVPLESPASTTGAGEPRNLVGTLVNGAGLAMNTNDVLHIRLSSPPTSTSSANFLDTGGKATSQTISTSFKLILSDPRVSVVFVNIFGGLTLCDMIAEGIILAFKEVGVNKPVVVRLRGTNEEKGQKILEEANLPIQAFDDFEEAVREVGRLANEAAAEKMI